MQIITTIATIIRDPAEINTIRDTETGGPEGEEKRDINDDGDGPKNQDLFSGEQGGVTREQGTRGHG
ncbi:hypothetical protein R3I94_017868 [Phoxinus phoxinus]